MPNISINELQLFNNIDGSQVFANVDASNLVTYQSRVSSIFYDNAIKTNAIENAAVNSDKIAGNSVDNVKIVNTDDYTFNSITLNSPSDHFTARGLSYSFPAQREANKFLKHTSEGVLEWATAAEVAGGGTSNAVVANDSLLPVGSIVQWGSNDAPIGWLLCNGSTFDGTVYPDLSAVVNENFGARDGNNFKLPNLLGRFPIGIGTGTDINGTLSSYSIGDNGGSYLHRLTLGEMPQHNHLNPEVVNGRSATNFFVWHDNQTPGYQGTRVNHFGSGSSDAGRSTMGQLVLNNGESQRHNNVPPFLAVNYIIKAKPTTLIDFNPLLGGGLSAIDSNNIINTENFNLSSKEIGIFKDDNQFQYDGDGKLQLKERKILTDTQYVGVNGGTIDINLNSCSSRTGLEYCLCDFTDSSNILNETTRCDIRGVYICTCAFQAIGCGSCSENTDVGAGILSNGATEYRKFAGTLIFNGDDDGGIISETFLPINANETSFCLCHRAFSDVNSVKTTIVGVQINKYI